MTYPTSSPTLAPEYRLHRTVADAADSAPETNKAHGMNMSGFRHGVAQIKASASADPDVEVLVWNAAAGKFVSQNPVVAPAGLGTGKSYDFKFDALDRVVFISVTGGITSGDTVEIWVAGANE